MERNVSAVKLVMTMLDMEWEEMLTVRSHVQETLPIAVVRQDT